MSTMTMIPEGMVLVPMTIALVRKFPWITLVALCCILVVVLPSFTLAMGAWVLALLLVMVRTLRGHRRRSSCRSSR